MAKRRLKKARRGRAAKPEQGMQILQHPLTGVDPDVLRQALIAVGERSHAQFDRILNELHDLLRRWSPFQFLTTLSAWGLHAGVGPDGVEAESIIPQLQQHHLELLQALALQVPFDEWGSSLASPSEIQEVIDKLLDIAAAFHQRRLVAMREERDPQGRTVLLLQEHMRTTTQIVRNWGYFSDVVRIATELYAPLDSALKAHYGFGATDLIQVARHLIAIYDERFNERLSKLHKVFKARSVQKLVHAYFEQKLGLEGSPEKYLADISPVASIEEVKYRLLAHADLELVALAIAPADQISAQSGCDLETVRRVLDKLSLTPGTLNSPSAEFFFLANPVWDAPGIKTGDKYFFALPQVILSFIHPILRRLMEDAGIKALLDERRAIYLEAEVARIIGKALPQARVHTGATWDWEGRRYETDVLVTFGRVLLIAEAKSATLTAQGLRGAPDRVRRHVRELVVAPSEQSTRLQEIVQRAKNGEQSALAVTAGLSVDAHAVDTIVRVSVTLDDFSALSSSEGDLAEAGWIPAALELAPTLHLADLFCVADILDSPIRFIHYLSERGRLQRTAKISGDELDYLGFYLETSFSLGAFKDGEYRLLVNGMSHAIDHYYTSRDAGVTVPKPRPKSHPYFETLISRLEQRQMEAWTTMALDILSAMNLDEQKQVIRALEDLRRSVPRTYQDPGHTSSVQIVPPAPRDTMVLFFVYPPALVDKRHQNAEQLVNEALDRNGRQRCVLIGRNTDGWDEPYQFIGLASTRKLK